MIPTIEHSENKIITCFENEIGPGMLQPRVQLTYSLQIIHKKDRYDTNQLHMVCAFGILAALVFATLDWRTPGPISFSNSPDCVITLFSTCSIGRQKEYKLMAMGKALVDHGFLKHWDLQRPADVSAFFCLKISQS